MRGTPRVGSLIDSKTPPNRSSDEIARFVQRNQSPAVLYEPPQRRDALRTDPTLVSGGGGFHGPGLVGRRPGSCPSMIWEGD